VKGEFTISYGKLGPTEARLIAIAANTLVFFIGNPTFKILSVDLSIYDWVVTAIIIVLAIICSSTTYIQSRILSRIDPRK
jgi:ABC-type antimicrobial peptide transport system permease subunit